MTLAKRRIGLDCGLSVRALAHEKESGDAATIVRRPDVDGLTAIIADGLGHGSRAAEASVAACVYVEKNPDRELTALFAALHRELLRTRGAVAGIARIDTMGARLELASLGNISLVLYRASGVPSRHLYPIAVPGVLGSAYRPVRVQAFDFGVGDVLVMHTDGVRPRFDVGQLSPLAAQQMADAVIGTHGKASDDAGVIVIRGVPPYVTSAPPPSSLRPSQLPPDAEHIPIRQAGDAECVAVAARTFAQRVGLSPRACWACGIAASELATNVLKHAGRGMATLSAVTGDETGLKLEVIDDGAGIADLHAAFQDGYSQGARITSDRPRTAGQGLGVGLGSVGRLMDRVEIKTSSGRGTRIIAVKIKE